MEKQLEVKPDIFCDNTNTPFIPKLFDTIFYDPPHGWGVLAMFFNVKTRAEYAKLYHKVKYAPTYYGLDKYKSRAELIKHIYYAQEEFYRILKDNGLLWFKWCDGAILLERVLTCFTDWIEMMRLVVSDPQHQTSTNRTYWVCLSKKTQKTSQQSLTQF